MAITKHTLYERRGVVAALNRHLGYAYDWQQMLNMWSSARRDNGLKGSDLTLEPCAYDGRTPLYSQLDMARFILTARTMVDFVLPSPKEYLVDDSLLASPIFPPRMISAKRTPA